MKNNLILCVLDLSKTRNIFLVIGIMFCGGFMNARPGGNAPITRNTGNTPNQAPNPAQQPALVRVPQIPIQPTIITVPAPVAVPVNPRNPFATASAPTISTPPSNPFLTPSTTPASSTMLTIQQPGSLFGAITVNSKQPEQVISQLSSLPAPWPQQLLDWLIQNKNDFSEQQLRKIEQIHQQKHTVDQSETQDDTYTPLRRPSDIKLEEEKAAPTASWTFEGAVSGAGSRAKAAAGWGIGKLGEAYEYAKDIPSSLWNYESSIGGGTKATASFGAIAAAPYVLGAAAATAGTAALVGGGVYGLTSLLDRLEYRYKTGEWSEVGAIKNLVLKLDQMLADAGRYPTISTITEALKDKNELYALDEDEFGLLTKAHTVLLKRYQKAYEGLSDQKKKKDREIINKVNTLRSNFGYNSNDLQQLKQYVNLLSNTFNISEVSAILSEYSRAIDKIKILEEKAKIEKKETSK